MRIEKINEDKSKEYFNTLQQASASIDTRYDDWKVQLLIADAINNHKRAFKCYWNKVK